MNGYQDSLRASKLPLDLSLVAEGDWTAGSGYRAAMALLQRDDRPDALFCANDYQAVGALEAARETGLAVPGEISIVGFDDRSIAATSSIPLTSVAIAHEAMAKAAIDRLFSAIDGAPQVKELIRVPCQLRVRQSS
jgi:LacI family transcriptional regulator